MQENVQTDRRRDKMIRNIIFDIGNVLTDYRWEGFLADKGFDAVFFIPTDCIRQTRECANVPGAFWKN